MVIYALPFPLRKNSTDAVVHGRCSCLIGIILIVPLLTLLLFIREKVISVYLSDEYAIVSSDATGTRHAPEHDIINSRIFTSLFVMFQLSNNYISFS